MAGFFSTLFGGGAEREANERNQALYGQYKTEGQQNLASGLDKSLASLTSGYGDANATLGQNKDVWSQYGTNANGALDSGLSNSLASLGQAKAAYDPLAALGTKYGAGSSLYLDSLGVNGAAGNANAVNSFQAGPGYEFTRDQGLDALNRRRASAGMLNSGNADIDALTYGTGLANQTYGDWQTRLAGFVNPELQATQGAAAGYANVNGQIASLYGTDASNRVGVAGNVANGTAGVNSAIAGNQSALGARQAGLYTQNATDLTNLAGSVTSGRAAGNNMQAAGEAAGARNGLGAALSLANLGAQAMGGGFSGLLGGSTSTGATMGGYGAGSTPGSGMMGGIRYPAF